ncbi:high mobility group B protein 6 isoform X1 [Physcomitrium patens]|uniref:high mobility group B protein 6 isoform X1 n=1 Tax=Physcomitrium patens TaxID=3218 RepID=UPI000D179B1C|nr:high mobility group B protein 6-like isoform X1 [Physcomitrium patens]XP_024380210.1 high mobility group B protein 6-like isoform X1 [Physcomitrium patens]|eukprot:XP_024380209.1 high mobility group B protein 6-like isoform X1 [Physcomitrella patens]
MASKPRGKRAPKGDVAAEKENINAPPAATKGNAKTKGLKDTSNLSLEAELEAMTKALKQVSLEVEHNKAMLREKEEQLTAQAAETERMQKLLESGGEEKKKLEDKLRKLQKVQGFQPTLNLSRPNPNAPEDLTKKKKKDPNRLKKPKSAFLLWCKVHRQKVCEENPNATFAEISTILGDKWKNVSEEDRKPYEDRYKVEKDVYLKLVGKEKREAEALKLFHEEENKKLAQELLEQYLAYKKLDSLLWQEMESDVADGKKKKKEKDPLKPKHPITAFFAFSQSRRPALLELNKPVTEIAKILGEEWKSMSPAKRAPFEEIAAKEKERYSVELETYKKNKAEDLSTLNHEAEEKAKLEKSQALKLYKEKERLDQAKKIMKNQAKEKKDMALGKKDLVSEKDQAKEKKKAKDPNKPKKPLSSYLIFGMEMRKSLSNNQVGLNFAETNAHISQKWKELSEKDKEVWNEKAAVLKKKYDADMEEYRSTLPELSA